MTDENPAYVLSRGISAQELGLIKIWWNAQSGWIWKGIVGCSSKGQRSVTGLEMVLIRIESSRNLINVYSD